MNPNPSAGWTRRDFLRSGLAAGGLMLPTPLSHAGEAPRDFAFFVISDTHSKALEIAPDELEPETLEINRRLIDLLNQLPGQPLPEAMGGGILQPIRGVLHLGDMIDSGDKGTSAGSVRRQETEWKSFVADFGLTGNDGRLRFPLYEVHGNHDSVRETNVVINSVCERNRRRPGVSHVSENGLHYSWDWNGGHFVALGIVVGHNGERLPIGRYKAHDSLQFLKKDLETRVGASGRPVILLHHIDLLRYSGECSENTESGGEWSACDIAAFHGAITGYNIAAIFHGHLHALRIERWDGTSKSADRGGIPVFGCRNSGAGGINRGLFYCEITGGELVVRELASLKAPDGWQTHNTAWTHEWRVPLQLSK